MEYGFNMQAEDYDWMSQEREEEKGRFDAVLFHWEREGGRNMAESIWESMIYRQTMWGVLYFSFTLSWFIIRVWVLMTVPGCCADVSTAHFLSTWVALSDTG